MSFQNCRIVATGVDSTDYHEQDAPRGTKEFFVSPSSLKSFAGCPARWLAGYESPESKAKQWGSLLDTLLLTPEHFEARYAVQPPTYQTTGMQCPQCRSITDSKKCAKCKTERVEITVTKDWTNQSDTCNAWKEAQEAAGKEVITHDLEAQASEAVKVFHVNGTLHNFLADCDKQVHVAGVWHDAATDVVIPVQCLIDALPKATRAYWRGAGDVKSTRNASPWMWSKWSSQMMYHLQAAFDLDLVNAAEQRPEGDERDEWYFLVQENYAPWQTAGYIVSQAKLEIGRTLYRSYLAKYAKCLATGHWPDYIEDSPPDTVVAGWRIDEATKWDEQAAMNSIPPIEEPAEPEFVSETPT